MVKGEKKNENTDRKATLSPRTAKYRWTEPHILLITVCKNKSKNRKSNNSLLRNERGGRRTLVESQGSLEA